MTSILYNDLKTLIGASSLVPEEQYCITDYVTTVAKTNYTSAGYKFDIVVTALTNNILYEYALLMSNASEDYFDAEGLLIYNIRYNVNNIIPGYNNDWVDANGKGCIYYMVDNKGNEAPFDFKNIKYNGKFLFNSTIDNTDTSQTVSEYNVVKEVIEDGYFKLPQISFNDACSGCTIGTNADQLIITESSNLQIGDNCKNSEFTNVDNTLVGNDLSNATLTSIDGAEIGDNNNNIIATNQTNLIIKDKNTTITLGGGSNGVIVDSNNTDVSIGTNAKDVYINGSKTIDLGNNIEQFNISSSYNMDVADDCKLFNLNETNHLTATTGCENINTIKNDYITLTEEVKNVTISDRLTNLILDGSKLTGSDTKLIIQQDEKVVVTNEQTNSEVVLVEDGTTASNPTSYINDSPSDGFVYGRKDGDWEQIDTNDYEVTYDDVVDALTYIPISTDKIGVANGLATLDAQGYVLNAQLPSYVDDIIEVDTFALLPDPGEKGKIYIVTDSGKTYRWATTQYVTISESLTLGTGSEQAYPGNLGAALRTDVDGKANISHTHTKSEVGLSNVDNTSDAAKPISTATQTALNSKANKATTLSGYGITDAVTQTDILYADLLALINNDGLIPSSNYRITDYTTTTTQADTQSAGHNFDVIVTALSANELSEDAKCVRKDSDTYFTNANLETWEIKYCVDNDTNRFEWANTVSGKGVIYYMKDNHNNECPYDFKNIQFLNDGVYVFTFGGTTDDSLTGNSTGNTIKELISSNKLSLNFNTFDTNCSFNVFGFNSNNNTFGIYCNYNTFGDECQSNNFGYDCYSNNFGYSCRFNNFGNEFGLNNFGDSCWHNIFGSGCYSNNFGNEFIYNEFGDDCYFNTFGGNCSSNIFDDYCIYNTFGDLCSKNNFGVDCGSNTFGTGCSNNNFGDECTFNTFGDYCGNNTFDAECRNNKFGKNCFYNTFGAECSTNIFGSNCSNNEFVESCQFNTFGNDCNYNTFNTYCFYNTFGDDCSRNNFYHGLNGTTKKDYVKNIVLEIGCKYNNFYSNVTTSGASYLQRIRIKGLEHLAPTSTIITLPANTNYEWVVAKNSDGTIEQYCPEDHYLTDAQKTKLAGIAAGAEVNVNADWNAITGDARILNKPTSMPASDVSAWAKAATKPSYVASDIGGLGVSYRWLTDAYINTWNAKEPAITKLTAFNKNFGTTAGTISEGNHAHTFASLTSKPNTLTDYGITDVPNDNKTYGRKNRAWSEIDKTDISGKEDKTNKVTTLTNNNTDYPTTKAVTDAISLMTGASIQVIKTGSNHTFTAEPNNYYLFTDPITNITLTGWNNSMYCETTFDFVPTNPSTAFYPPAGLYAFYPYEFVPNKRVILVIKGNTAFWIQ